MTRWETAAAGDGGGGGEETSISQSVETSMENPCGVLGGRESGEDLALESGVTVVKEIRLGGSGGRLGVNEHFRRDDILRDGPGEAWPGEDEHNAGVEGGGGRGRPELEA